MVGMNRRDSNEAWEALTSVSDDQIPLLRAALMVAQDEYPALDIDGYVAEFDRHATELAARMQGLAQLDQQLSELNRFLFRDLGFTGNHGDYYDPRNCYINEVLDRRLGIPITLAVVQIELARRVGVPLEGVSFPGHFLVRMPLDDGLVVLDPYHQGRSIDAQELKLRARPHLGGEDIDDQQLLTILAPATHRAILARMLRNLKGVYAQCNDWDKALRCADRLVRLEPQQAEEQRDRGMFYLKVGHLAAARDDLGRYLALRPQAEDADAVRSALIEASARPARFN
jgi:regulator of sirC expression with transglutaminase-like and TPR domain